MNKLFFHIGLILPLLCLSQDTESELWFKMNLKDRINDNISISFEPGSRYNTDDFFFTKQFIDASSELIIHKGKVGSFSFEIGGRLTKIPKQKKLGARHYYTLVYSNKIKNFDYSLRSRLFYEKNLTNHKKKYFRNKLSFQYSYSKLFRPFVDYEFLNGLDYENDDKFRYSFGNSFKISKKRTIKLFYRLQESIQDNNDKKEIFGIYLIQKL